MADVPWHHPEANWDRPCRRCAAPLRQRDRHRRNEGSDPWYMTRGGRGPYCIRCWLTTDIAMGNALLPRIIVVEEGCA